MSNYIRFVGVDVETTGLHAEKDDRITEIALVVYDYLIDDKEFVHRKTFSTLVNPQRSIPAKIQEITGIDNAMVAKAPTFDIIAPKLKPVFDSADCVIAHNLEFDAKFLVTEMNRAKQTFNDESEPFCTMQEGRFASSMGEVPRLQKLCWSLGVEFDATAAHRADYDTERMMAAFVEGCLQGWFKPECLKGELYE